MKQLGERVRIVTGASFKGFVESYGIEHYPITLDYLSADVDPKLIEAAQSSTNPLKMLLTFNKMKKYARLMTDETYAGCLESDIIVYHPGCVIGYFAGEQLGIPSVLAAPFPMHETKAYSSVIAYGKVNMPVKSSYVLLHKLLFMASKTGVQSFWREKFGALPNQFGSPFNRIDHQHPAVIACSNAVFPRPTDWHAEIHQAGYWFLPPHTPEDIPTALTAFLASGEKPIYFGFGSVFNEKDKVRFVEQIIEALQKTGKRGIICGMGAIPDLPANILAIDGIDHQWLFPQCAAVCHHGGAGTSAAGFAAGVPSIIVPFSNDQFAWAHRAYDIGVGSKPIYKKKMTTAKLISALGEIEQPARIQQAQRLANQIAQEHGAHTCASVIVKLKQANN
ncbi:MAG: glycosyltransferase [Culicoidibacterales bacterium]